ncbi:MAG TPA: glycosyl hydrolase [Candidatus Acidoferrales bacterium]|nr:glycosyl hydrolase [Candidatus Acidoferrales bacterium]
MPDFTCNFSQPGKPFVHFWEHTVGSGHAPLALRADWQAQLLLCHNELGFQHVRFHALLSEQMETLICEENKLIYSFFNADQIIDFLLSIGMRPFVELSFMPRTLASGNTTVFRYQANVTPPKDYGHWATLIGKLTAHWVERYGANEVREWFFEAWNEPNLKAFWTGTQQDYFKLYRSTVEAVKSIDPLLKVGGPATARNEWISEFLDFCDQNKVPVDFITTHHYPTDAFGKIGADTVTQLEHAPRGVMREDAVKTRDQARGLPVYYTEWNISSNPRDPLHDEPFTAAFATKIVMEASGLVAGYSFWTFSDIFSENYFPSLPFQGGFGLLNIHGIAKPAYRGFELLHHLGTEMLDVVGSHETVDAWAIRKENTATILLTNHAMPRHPIHTELSNVHIAGAPRPRGVYIERIDQDHANARRLWQAMGEPNYLSAVQVEELKATSCLVKQSQPWTYEKNAIHLSLALPPHAVAAITIEFA